MSWPLSEGARSGKDTVGPKGRIFHSPLLAVTFTTQRLDPRVNPKRCLNDGVTIPVMDELTLSWGFIQRSPIIEVEYNRKILQAFGVLIIFYWLPRFIGDSRDLTIYPIKPLPTDSIKD